MRRIILIVLAILLVLGAIEGIAWWWMHPAPAGLGEPVLAYRPQVGRDPARSAHLSPTARNDEESEQESVGRDPARSAHLSPTARNADGEPELRDQESVGRDPARSAHLSPTARNDGGSEQGSGVRDQESANATAQSTSSTDHRSLITDHSSSPSSPNLQSPISNLSSFTPLPEIYRQAAPMLRCTSGQVFHVQIHDTASLHGAFFEWDGTDTGSVLEAFRHMPEACMGAIGMELVSKEKPIQYTVGLDRRAGPLVANGAGSEGEVRDQESVGRDPARSAHLSPTARNDDGESEVSNQETANATAPSTSSTDHRSLITDHSTPNIQYPISNIHLHFDHTVFRDPGQGGGPLGPGPLVHAFRAVWVSGTPAADARSGLDGRGFDQLRSIRLNSALTRYRPRHARVVQGAVRGLHTPEAAWAAFEEHMLKDLKFE